MTRPDVGPLPASAVRTRAEAATSRYLDERIAKCEAVRGKYPDGQKFVLHEYTAPSAARTALTRIRRRRTDGHLVFITSGASLCVSFK